MTDYDLTPEELRTLASFQSYTPPHDMDPQHFVKLVSLALITQKDMHAE